MKKKILAMLLCTTALMSVAACGSKTEEPTNEDLGISTGAMHNEDQLGDPIPQMGAEQHLGEGIPAMGHEGEGIQAGNGAVGGMAEQGGQPVAYIPENSGENMPEDLNVAGRPGEMPEGMEALSEEALAAMVAQRGEMGSQGQMGGRGEMPTEMADLTEEELAELMAARGEMGGQMQKGGQPE